MDHKVWRSVLLFAGLVLALVFALSTFAGGTSASPSTPDSDFETMTIPADAPIEMSDLSAESAMPQLDQRLQLVAEAAAQGPEAVAEISAELDLNVVGDRVQVVVVTDETRAKAAQDAIRAAGGEVTKTASENTLIQAWISAEALPSVAEAAAIDYVRPPAELTLHENPQGVAATSEALSTMNVPAWHAAGYKGQGIKIAVIDGGFSGYNSLLGSDLPANVTAKNFVDGQTDAQVNGTTPHGTACAEILYDIAPQAQFYLIKINTEVDLEQAVDYAISQGVDVISTSIGWYNVTPGDGTGIFGSLVNRARSNGIVWATAAGNDRQLHWGGTFSDPNSDQFHNFGSSQDPINYFGPGDGQAYVYPAGITLRVFLRWDDWGNPTQDYALSVYRFDQNSKAWVEYQTSNSTQNGLPGQTPTEAVFVNTSGGSTAYGFAVRRVNSNRNVSLEIFAPKSGPRMDQVVNARSLSNLADSTNAITVAALDVSSPYPQESYSGEGPTNGAGGTVGGGIIKPDLAGFANVSTEAYGSGTNKFNGTSSATPHVAGALALALSANPAFSPQQVSDYLFARAKDMGAAGRDSQFGYGRVHLGAPPSAEPTPTPTATPKPINVTDRSFVPVTMAEAVGVVPTVQAAPTATPNATTGTLQVINEIGGNLSVNLIGYDERTFTPGTFNWNNIPAGFYVFEAQALSGACGGSSLVDGLEIIGGDVTPIQFTCSSAQALTMEN